MAEVNLVIFSALCATQAFSINGIPADSGDFGEHYDNAPDEAEPYGCGDMRFFPKPATDEVLKKYGISANEYTEIAEKLESGLSFGGCGWCV